MAQITPDTFDPLRRFIGVRLQQGVPIVDADWNEMDDVRRFGMRSYLKWYVGSGVPHGSEGFRVRALPVPAANSFVISAGVPAPPPGETPYNVGLRHVGRCLVEGAEATIDADVTFRAQPLHVAVPGAAALATQRGTTPVAEMPVLTGTICVYLDVWDRLVRPDELPALVFTDIGTESCARIRQEWVVRTRIGTTAPVAGNPDFQAGHVYYALARIDRVAGDPTVFASQIVDLREQRLQTPPSTLIDDLLGTSSDRYRRGLDRPVVSLRTALNALMRGELPSSEDQAIAPDVNTDSATRAIVLAGGGTQLFWHSNRVSATNQVFGTSWTDTDPGGAAAAPTQITSLGAGTPAVALLPTSPAPAIFLAYATQGDIRFRRAASIAALPAAPETPIAAQADPEANPVVVRTGQIVTTLWNWNGPGTNDRIRFRRRLYDASWTEAAATWMEGDAVDFSSIRPAAATADAWFMHAAADTGGRLWVAFRTFTNNIAVARLTASTGAIETWTNKEFDAGAGSDQQPFVLVEGTARIWVFWRADAGIFHGVFDLLANSWGPATLVPGTGGAIGENERPCAVVEADGGIWLIWSRTGVGGSDIWAARRNPGTGGWGAPRQLTASAGDNDFAAGFAAGGAIRLFFRSNRTGGQFDLFTKSVITTI